MFFLFSFFDNMSKAREEWLNMPLYLAQRAAYLNALVKVEAKTKTSTK